MTTPPHDPAGAPEKKRRAPRAKRDPNISPKTGKPKDMRYSRAATMHFASRKSADVKAKQSEGGKKGSRLGVPDGYTKEEAHALRKAAETEAKEIIQKMADEGIITKEEALGNEALEFAISVVRAKVDPTRERLNAAKLVLEFTKSKPASKVEATVTKAEDFLAALVNKGE